MQPITLFKFHENCEISLWKVVNDSVMGGISESKINLNIKHHGSFEGMVSLENNGGFCSVKYAFEPIILDKNKMICLYIKGDGKIYQFRLKNSKTDSHSYIYSFETNGDWQNIEIPITEFQPYFRGRKLDLPNYDGSNLEEIAFLIGNKKREHFELLIDQILIK